MAIIAGWMAGYVMAIVSTLALTYLAYIGRDSRLVSRWLESGASPLLLAGPLSVGTFLGWTMFGLLAGSAYHMAEYRDDTVGPGLAPPVFLIAMAAIAVMPLPLLLIFWPRRWWLFLSQSVAFLLCFAWLRPALASQ